MIITIDGPAGAGKSTAARLLAERLGFEFLDTGAMYRAVAWACVDRGIDLKDVDAVAETAAGISIQFEQDRIICNGQDVTTDIRSAEASHAASIVAAVPAVRLEMVRLQRESAAGHRYVTEGRDQGSEVFPDSECKFFLTADPQERAERRLLELQNRGQSESIEEVLTQIIDRDERDRSREIGPLVKADDAIEVDTSGKTIEHVVDFLEQKSRERLSLLRL
ncbi:MAG: (d)CMP kinase [Planctomycetaceae bacterium]|jgi:cytidylate kinase|nr:(d)CMP kinase [Planctomycetaceae bacterium]